jgi:hypothetical protein
VIVTVAFSATIADGASVAPSGAMRRIRSGATGSLKIKVSAGGTTATTPPSAGVDLTSAAWARAGGADATTPSSAATSAAMHASERPAGATSYLFGSSFNPGAGSE